MTDKEPEEQNGQEPPKINVNGTNGNGNGIEKPDVPDEMLTSKDDSAAPPKISIPTGKPLSQKKKETTRIDLSQAEVAPSTETPPDVPPDVDKKSTLRVDAMAEGIGKETAPDFPPKHATMRIQLEDDAVSPDAETVDEAQVARGMDSPKKETARIDLSEVLGGQQEQTPKPSGGPKTIRLKKPDSGAPTVSLKRPASGDSDAGTMMISPPEDLSEAADKGSTARIDLPAQESGTESPTRRKTIRIKRPDGATGTARPMTISRTTEVTAPIGGADDEEDGPGVGMVIVGIAATLVAAVLVYVLVAQLSSIGLDELSVSLPWAGRIL